MAQITQMVIRGKNGNFATITASPRSTLDRVVEVEVHRDPALTEGFDLAGNDWKASANLTKPAIWELAEWLQAQLDGSPSADVYVAEYFGYLSQVAMAAN